MTVLKVMFTAIVTAMLGLLFFSLFGWLDFSMLYINPTYLWPQITGGLILGVGFVVGGYCPGTSIVASATGKIDGYFFIGGIIAGMLTFGEVYSWIENFHKSSAMGTVLLSDWLPVSMGVIAFAVIIMALSMFWGAEWLERKFNKREASI
jgi:uncharacterized membrane protein YedE/YeeE